MRRHHSKTPYLFEISEEFLAYLQNERGTTETDPPFLLELAHYEWVEQALLISDAVLPAENPLLLDDPLSQTIYLSELAWPLAYRFPVHRIGPDYQPRLSAGGTNFFARLPRSGRSGEVSGDRLRRLSPVGNAAKRRTSPSDHGASRDGNRQFR